MPPSRPPTVNYQEHFGIDNNARRRGATNPQGRNDVTPVATNLTTGADAPEDQDDSDLTGTEGLSEDEFGLDGDDATEGLIAVGDDVGLEEGAIEGSF